MCGIAGFAGLNAPDLLRRMTRLLTHRGPDDEGYFETEGVGLGMRRLSVIDVETGRQPIHNEAGTVWAVFNGEIYNYLTLRQDLEQRGHRFVTNSDSEVIVHLYEEYGDDFMQSLRGMFTIALWDETKDRLLLLRDRVGIKPLYYAQDAGQLYFASEMKALLAVPGVRRDVDQASFLKYLGFLYVPAPGSIFQDVQKLQPGHCLSFCDGQVSSWQYWDLAFQQNPYADEVEAADHLYSVLDESVRLRMVSDVPLGGFLSGGLDSSAIAALMSKHSTERVQTFCVGFGGEGEGFNELAYARQVADHLGTEHHERMVDYDVIDLLPKMLWHLDEPFGNPTAVLAYLLSEYARQHVTVALSGTGGDEAFLGYPRHLGLMYANSYRRVPAPCRSLLRAMIGVLPESTASSYPLHRFGKRIRRFVDGVEAPEQESYVKWLTYFDSAQRGMLAGDDQDVDGFMYDALGRHSVPIADRAQYADIKTFLPYNQLEYMDKMSMACSLEARVPFCDHELLEFSATLPSAWKIRGRHTKRILKRACKGLLPDHIINRRKVGFDAPAGAWFKGRLRPVCHAVFSPEAIGETGAFSPQEVQRLWHLHLSGRRDLSLQLWIIFVFEVWHRMYIRQGITDSPDFTLTELLQDQGLTINAG